MIWLNIPAWLFPSLMVHYAVLWFFHELLSMTPLPSLLADTTLQSSYDFIQQTNKSMLWKKKPSIFQPSFSPANTNLILWILFNLYLVSLWTLILIETGKPPTLETVCWTMSLMISGCLIRYAPKPSCMAHLHEHLAKDASTFPNFSKFLMK